MQFNRRISTDNLTLTIAKGSTSCPRIIPVNGVTTLSRSRIPQLL